jgi:5'-nucleotidase
MKRPLILITNDDGDTAQGIQVLTRLMMEIGDVVVMAPDGGRSGQSNAITVSHPIRYTKIEEREGLVRYKCTGTPTDCVKLALHDILDRKPDLLVSGINHGSNAAINIIYSGTMGAVLEGCENGLTSIGFSICDHSMHADFSQFEKYITQITLETLKNGLPYGVCLNVNAPKGEIKGIKIARQCKGNWTEEYAQGRTYFWLTGYFKNHEPDMHDTDEWALANGYVSIVPSKIDLTDYNILKSLQKWEL